MKSSLFQRYQNEIRPKLQKELGIKNPLQVPSIEKICINVGMGSYLQRLGSKDFSFVEENIKRISGQKPVVRKAKLSVSNFKLREGQPVGISVILRRDMAYNFLEKLIHIVYPRVRDFRGVNRNVFDSHGNCSVGFSDHTVFPEAVVPEDSRKIHGLQVTIITSTSDADHSHRLLESFGFPLKKPLAPQEEKSVASGKEVEKEVKKEENKEQAVEGDSEEKVVLEEMSAEETLKEEGGTKKEEGEIKEEEMAEDSAEGDKTPIEKEGADKKSND